MFTDEEIRDRVEIVKDIVRGAYEMRAQRYTPAMVADAAVHWEESFRQVPTQHLDELYKIGMKKRCETPKQFLTVWEAKKIADLRLAEYKSLASRRLREERLSAPTIPEDYKAFRKAFRKVVKR